MRKTISRKDVLLTLAQNTVESKNFNMAELLDDGFVGATELEVVQDWINYRYAGSPNVFLAELYEYVTAQECIVEGKAADRHVCHCCLRLTLTDDQGYEICPWCNWEDVGPVSPHVGGSPNRTTIAKTRIELNRTDRDQDFHRWRRSEGSF